MARRDPSRRPPSLTAAALRRPIRAAASPRRRRADARTADFARPRPVSPLPAPGDPQPPDAPRISPPLGRSGRSPSRALAGSGHGSAVEPPIPAPLPGPVVADDERARVARSKADPELLAALQDVLLAGASDLHVSVGTAPMLRIDGALRPVAGQPALGSRAGRVGAGQHPDQRRAEGALRRRTSSSTSRSRCSANARFRVNFYQQRGATRWGVPSHPDRDQVARGARRSGRRRRSSPQLPRGLVLVTGPTGSGKSTTLAALIDLVNRTRADHIVTVEDPIEFLHTNKRSLVNQREVGHDTHSFANALKHVLRQDPDVILIGELRDLETISVALTAAETGHLVFATLHTQDAAQTIDRVIDVFPPHQQGQIRAQLAATLQGVVCQTLVQARERPRPRGRDRGPASPRRPSRNLDPRGQDLPDRVGACRPVARSACTRWTSTSPSSSTTGDDHLRRRAREGARPETFERLVHRERHRSRTAVSGQPRCLSLEEALTCRSPSRPTRTRAATPPARSSRASSRRPSEAAALDAAAQRWDSSPIDGHRVARRHRPADGDQDRRLRQGRRAQGPRGHEPADGDHDQRPASRCCATLVDPRRSRPRTRSSPASCSRSRATSRTAGRSPTRSRKHPIDFPPLMINMIRAGETGGFLEGALESIADELREGGQAPRRRSSRR